MEQADGSGDQECKGSRLVLRPNLKNEYVNNLTHNISVCYFIHPSIVTNNNPRV